MSAGIDDCPCFSTMIPIDCKITIFFLYLFVYFFCNNYNIGELTSAISKETQIAWVSHPLINEKIICQ